MAINNTAESFVYRFFEKGTRTYALILEKDLFENWTIKRCNGSSITRLNYTRKECFNNYIDALNRLEQLAYYRVKNRHYFELN